MVLRAHRLPPNLRPDARARALVPYCRSPHCLHRTFLYHSCTNLRRDARTFLLRPSAWAPRLSERLRFARACLPRSCCSRAHPTPTARLFTRLRAHHRPHTILPKMADARTFLLRPSGLSQSYCEERRGASHPPSLCWDGLDVCLAAAPHQNRVSTQKIASSLTIILNVASPTPHLSERPQRSPLPPLPLPPRASLARGCISP